MRYRYLTCDVFTDQRFGGNQLAVLPQAEGLSDTRMQQIAREFNYSETTFVLPPESGHTRKVRIFTPATELAFAGHPNIGTAFALASDGSFGDIDSELTVTFEEQAGLVPVRIERRGDTTLWCELTAPQPLSLGDTLTADRAASVLCLEPHEILTHTHPPQVASVGIAFLLIELSSREALERARICMPEFEKLAEEGVTPDVLFYVRSNDDFDIRARMFAPLDGVPEDPATGSANCALAALLSHCDAASDGEFSWRIAQGIEMGRPSLLAARAEKRAGLVTKVRIGGDSVLVSEGFIETG